MPTNTVPVRELGRSGLKVSCLGLGCMGMSFGIGDRSNLTDEQCVDLIHEAFKMGVFFFDTALIYGPRTNEELLGKAIATLPREKLVIATKCGLDFNAEGQMVRDARPDTIRASVEGSLKRLGTSYIDLFYLHRLDTAVPIENIAATMLDLKKAGKIRHWGLCEVTAATIRKAHAVCPLTAIQSEYSVIHRLVEKEVLPVLEELGIGLVPYSPLGHGFLTATIDPKQPFTENDARNHMPRYSKENMEANAPIIALITEFAEKKNATPAQIALAWVLAQRDYIAPIPGTTKLHRLQENVGATAIHFSADEVKDFDTRLDAIAVHGARYAPAAMAMLERPDDVSTL